MIFQWSCCVSVVPCQSAAGSHHVHCNSVSRKTHATPISVQSILRIFNVDARHFRHRAWGVSDATHRNPEMQCTHPDDISEWNIKGYCVARLFWLLFVAGQGLEASCVL